MKTCNFCEKPAVASCTWMTGDRKQCEATVCEEHMDHFHSGICVCHPVSTWLAQEFIQEERDCHQRH